MINGIQCIPLIIIKIIILLLLVNHTEIGVQILLQFAGEVQYVGYV